MRDAEVPVRTGRERDLGVADVLTGHLAAELVGDQIVVVRRPYATRDGQVDLGEVGEVAVGEPAAQACDIACGQVDAIAPG